MKVYYSHPKTYRHSTEANEDISLIKSFGNEVENPYDPKFSDLWQSDGIQFGKVLVEMCDGFAFRPLSNGKISAGAGKELRWALESGKPIFEMPNFNPFDSTSFESRLLSIDDTVEFFKTIGK